MIIYSGKAVNKKTAVGMARVINSSSSLFNVERVNVSRDAIDTELLRLDDALHQCMTELSDLAAVAAEEVGNEGAAIFEMHSLLLADDGFTTAIRACIADEQIAAPCAVAEVSRRYADRFSAMDDEIQSARADDILDVGTRLVAVLNKQRNDTDVAMSAADSGANITKLPYVYIAETLLPSDIIAIGKKNIMAIVTKEGTITSHVAILADMMGIPAVVGVQELDLNALGNNTMVVVDGDDSDSSVESHENGMVYIMPTLDIMHMASAKIHKQKSIKENLSKMIGQETITHKGQRIILNANISSIDELEYALDSDAEGIGLVRTEFLFMGATDFPSEAIQEAKYREIMERTDGREVVFRTMDAGGDKPLSYVNIKSEENPALGMRGIRICLSKNGIQLFKNQLRALFKVAVDYDNLKIMYPLITSTLEITRIREIIEEIKGELIYEGVDFRIPKQGVMIETPAAVLMAEELAQMADFFSIGTNDLTQYTLAADRTNENVSEYYMSQHPAILREILMTTRAAHKFDITVTICGEMAGEATYVDDWLAMGIDELSVSPNKILELRKIIRDK